MTAANIVDYSYGDLGHFEAITTQPQVSDTATVTGYPCDLPDSKLGEQYTSTGTVLGLESFPGAENQIVRFDANVAGCNSGSPVYSDSTVYALVTEGYSDQGKGVLISPAFMGALQTAIQISNRIYLPLIAK